MYRPREKHIEYNRKVRRYAKAHKIGLKSAFYMLYERNNFMENINKIVFANVIK